MKKKVDYGFTVVLLLLGSIHTLLTPMFFKHFNENFLWFAGTGLSLVYLSFLNFSRILTTLFGIRLMCVIGNSLGLAFMICLMNTGVGVSPQAIVSLVCYLSLFLFSLYDVRQSKTIK
jgi:hypothetical protein